MTTHVNFNILIIEPNQSRLEYVINFIQQGLREYSISYRFTLEEAKNAIRDSIAHDGSNYVDIVLYNMSLPVDDEALKSKTFDEYGGIDLLEYIINFGTNIATQDLVYDGNELNKKSRIDIMSLINTLYKDIASKRIMDY
jgi:hypothetical protein